VNVAAKLTSVPLGYVVGADGLIVDGDWVESKDQDPDGDVRLIQLADIGVGEYLSRIEG
jgi:type I restriction enzyme, S subunit